MDRTTNPFSWFVRRFWVQAMLLQRGMTLGVRVIAPDAGGSVLLVRHGYTAGWHLPGGGVDRGETMHDAALRELEEETGWRAQGALELRGIAYHRNMWKGDHVAVYVAQSVAHVRPVAPSFEIQEIGFFPVQDLPNGTTNATRARLAEWQEGRAVQPYWS